MFDLLNEAAENWKNKVGFVCNGLELSYNECRNMVLAIGNELLKSGVSETSKVALIIEDPIDFILSLFAISYCKSVVIPIYLKTGNDKINKILDTFEIDYVLTFDQHEINFKSHSIHRFTANENEFYLYKINDGIVDNSLLNTEMILFSSGTTNLPKAVMLSKKNITSNTIAISKYLQLSQNDKILLIKNLNHASSIIGEMLVSVLNGCTLYLTTKLPRANTVLKLIDTNQITVFFAIPYILKNIISYKNIDKYNIDQLRIVNFYGGRMESTDILKLCEILPLSDIIYSYGLTEASPRVTYIKKQDLFKRPLSCGYPIDGVSVKIKDNNGVELPYGQVGEITVEGPNVMQGYYRNMEQTKKTLKDGSLYTHDMGYMDEDGYLYFTGRKDNMLIIAGKNVHPEEIEEVLNEHPGVTESLVVKESESSDTLFAYITVDSTINFNINDLFVLSKNKLEFYKIPARIEVVDEFQKTISGKIIRKQLFS